MMNHEHRGRRVRGAGRWCLAGAAWLALAGGLIRQTQAADQIWDGDGGDALFTNAANWAAGAVPGAAGISFSADAATFPATAFTNVTLDAARGLGTLLFAGPAGDYTLSGADVRLNNFAAITNSAGNTATITVNNNILLESTLQFNNASAVGAAAGRLVVNGSVALKPSLSAATRTLYLTANSDATPNPDVAAVITLNGVIRNGGTNGTALAVRKEGNGVAFINNPSNTYANGTLLFAGALRLGADNVLGSGPITFNGGAIASDGPTSRSLTNAWTTGNNVNPVFGAAATGNNITSSNTGPLTISGPGTLARTTAGLTQFNFYTDVALTGTIGETGAVVGVQLNPQGLTNTLTLSGDNSFSGQSIIRSGTVVIHSLRNIGGGASGLGAPTNAANGTISLGNGGAATLRYAGSSDSTSDRQVNLDGYPDTALESSGAGTLTLTSGIGFTSVDQGRILTLSGTNAGENTISGTLANNGTGSLVVSKQGSGRWRLTGGNTYSGVTTINAGVLEGQNGIGLPGFSQLQLRGGVFQSSGTFTRDVSTTSTDVNWGTGSGGGFAARGGVLTLRLNGGTGILTWGAGSFIKAGETLIFGSTSADNLVDFQNRLKIAEFGSDNTNRTIRVDDNAASATDRARISGAISSDAQNNGLIKTGEGRLELATTNTYNGPTLISAGTLALTAAGSISNSTIVSLAGGSSAALHLTTSSGLSTNTDLSVGASSGKVRLDPGVNQTIFRLTLGGEVMATGTWGSSASDAANRSDHYFNPAGSGKLTVSTGKEAPQGLVLIVR